MVDVVRSAPALIDTSPPAVGMPPLLLEDELLEDELLEDELLEDDVVLEDELLEDELLDEAPPAPLPLDATVEAEDEGAPPVLPADVPPAPPVVATVREAQAERVAKANESPSTTSAEVCTETILSPRVVPLEGIPDRGELPLAFHPAP